MAKTNILQMGLRRSRLANRLGWALMVGLAAVLLLSLVAGVRSLMV
jgi:hypothetical protein